MVTWDDPSNTLDDGHEGDGSAIELQETPVSTPSAPPTHTPSSTTTTTTTTTTNTNTNTTSTASQNSQNGSDNIDKSKRRKTRRKKRLLNLLQAFLSRYWQYVKYCVKEMWKHKISYVLGTFACFIVVLVVSVSLSALDQVPIVFFNMAENYAGQFDMKISAQGHVPGSTLNMTRMRENLISGTNLETYEREFSFMSPRLIDSSAVAILMDGCTYQNQPLPSVIGPDIDLNYTRSWMYEGFPDDPTCDVYCLRGYCERNMRVNFVAYDTYHEKRMGFGRSWQHPRLGRSEAYISQELADVLEISVNSTITVLFDTKPLMGIYRNTVAAAADAEDESTWKDFKFQVYVPYRVADIVNTQGKVPFDDMDSVMVDYDHLLSRIADYAANDVLVDDTVREQFNSFNLSEYAPYVFVNAPNRIELYNQNDYSVLQEEVTQFASTVFYFLGFNQISASFPILRYMKGTEFLSMFVGLIINIIITVLSILSIILIYSLLMINVENRTFEMGVLRMIGMTKFGLVQLILIQSLCYAIPAVILGIIVGEIIYAILIVVVSHIFVVPLLPVLHWNGIIWAIVLGFVIPILASILPIRSALRANLRDAIDVSHTKTKAVLYTIERASENKISYTQIVLGLATALFGGGIYFFFPLALLSFNLSMLLGLFFVILLGMFFGLVVLATNFQPVLEKIVLYIFFFWDKTALKNLVLKNLIAHKVRNRKTTLMYALSLGFVFFLSVAFSIQIKSIQYATMQQFGTRLNVATWNPSGDLQNITLQSRLEAVARDFSPVAQGFAYRSWPLHDVTSWNRPSIMNVGKYASGRLVIVGITPNYFDIVDTSFLFPTEMPRVSYGLDTMLYHSRFTDSMVIGETYRSMLGLSDGLESEYALELVQGNAYVYMLLKPAAFLSGAPTQYFSQFPSATNQDAFVSFPTLVRLSQGRIQGVQKVPIRTMFVKVDETAPERNISALKNALSREASNYDSVRVYDREDSLSTIKTADTVLQLAFLLTTVAVLCMCFFSLISSMYTNVFEQAKEIGILRAIGMRRFALVRVYIYEAFVMIIASSILGIIIGCIVAYTMSAQMSLFSALPMPIVVPWMETIAIFILAFVFAAISAMLPLLKLLRIPIVTAMRRLVT